MTLGLGYVNSGLAKFLGRLQHPNEDQRLARCSSAAFVPPRGRQSSLPLAAVGQRWAMRAEGRTLGEPGPTQAPNIKGPRCLINLPGEL